MRLVVLPQAVRRVPPPLLNDFVALQKDVGLISVLGAIDAVRAAQIVQSQTFNFTPYVVAGLLFVLLAIPTVRLADWVRARRRRRSRAAGCCERAGAASVAGVVKTLRRRRRAARRRPRPSPSTRWSTLIGASGSGKSTLLRCVNLLETVDDGQVLLDGEDITDPRVDADGRRTPDRVVFQAYNLFPHMTVLDNVTLAPRVVHGVPAAEADERAHELLRRVGLADKADAYPDRLSGGQQQRVAIARALAMQPRAAAARRDHQRARPRARRRGARDRARARGAGMTILMATHEMGFARQVADTVCFLDGGRVLESGPPAQVLGEPEQERTRRFLSHLVEAGRLS